MCWKHKIVWSILPYVVTQTLFIINKFPMSYIGRLLRFLKFSLGWNGFPEICVHFNIRYFVIIKCGCKSLLFLNTFHLMRIITTRNCFPDKKDTACICQELKTCSIYIQRLRLYQPYLMENDQFLFCQQMRTFVSTLYPCLLDHTCLLEWRVGNKVFHVLHTVKSLI